MIYSYMIKKDYGHKGEAPALILLREYTKLYGKNDLLVCLPGYLSTTSKTINQFYKAFPKNASATAPQNFAYFFKGMNGTRVLKSGVSIQDAINNLYGGFSSKITSRPDHSKIVVFLENSNKSNKIHNGVNIDSKIISGNVKAILIGSSNQSFSSYLHLKKSANKGEADVFLVDESVFSQAKNRQGGIGSDNYNKEAIELINENLVNSVTLFKEISGKTSLREMFNNILAV